MAGRLLNGIIKYINKSEGYGYISSDEFENDIAFYQVKDFYKNEDVEFQIELSKAGKPFAKNMHGKIKFDEDQVKRCYAFSKKMIGNHNPGMIMSRTDQEIFRDDFRGKLGEEALICFIEHCIPNAHITGDINYDIYGRGKWDFYDLCINNKVVNVKSVKQYSSYLMIEQNRFNPDGSYSYVNDDGSTITIDLYVLMRITINALDDGEMTAGRDGIDTAKDLTTLIKEEAGRPVDTVYAEVLGGITHTDFWADKHFAPKGILCTKEALREICEDKQVNKITNPDHYGKTDVLQQNNYILSSNDLKKVEDLF